MSGLLKKAAVLALLAGTALSAPSSAVSRDVLDGRFDSRSAPILLKPQEVEDADSLAIVIDRSGSQLKGATNEVEMSVQNVADVATRVLGVQPVHPEFVPGFVQASPFQKVKANLYIGVDSLGEEYLSNQHMKHLQQLRNEHHSFKLTGLAYPASAAQMSATLATGSAPSRHGIVGDGWFNVDGDRVYAYSSASASSTMANVADLVSQSFDGRSLTVAMSGSPALALAHAVHPTVRAQHPSWHNLAFGIKGRTIASLLPSAQQHLEMSFADVEHVLATEGLTQLAKHAQVTLDAASHELKVQFGSHSAVYHLEQEESMEFFAELIFADHLLHQLQDASALNQLVNDQFPDHFALTFASLRGLREKFGEDSAEYLMAVKLLDHAIPTLIERFASLYHNSLVAEVVVLGANRHPLTPAVEARLAEVLPTEASDEFLPAIYLRQGADVSSVCTSLEQQLRSSVSLPSVQVICQPEVASQAAVSSYHDAQLFSMNAQLFQSAPSNSSNSTGGLPTDADIATYQIVLWTSILLVAVLVLVLCGLMNMDNRRDTMLYSRFNPNWADRKRR